LLLIKHTHLGETINLICVQIVCDLILFLDFHSKSEMASTREIKETPKALYCSAPSLSKGDILRKWFTFWSQVFRGVISWFSCEL
jgi:hypothetical protein